ncbi:restriction endonuclease subunit S [Klebsiella pneumoniae]|uniref:restriction endonuclease subunit S n=1 Tax=Klebsiella pneumoniae TaxID=573 RepID=UPI000BA31CE3|nr:restriction endonuclease subunit S [Klebsiella pneumoniae]EJN1490926.1 restriction endonuclease subunit S [Klebsiella pneumoniae]EJN1492362.1 restriction endonuclease subunit S [Klebsiella pneumoniae]EKU0224555.1 restriction endonuclease subunit S [Klebsiella pneumoniae]EKU0228866.1 restriction endonuclease subunit S [Klebsiella pneumoniae]EKZ6365732.1 restriction endonuclease subunit S [Klebsiella pneumoniae]
MAVEKLIVDHIDTWTTALQTRSTAGRGSSGKIDLYGIKKLRELILELAVRGKLVPQDPNDEPASVLLERIAAEKAELVKQGKIKKQKPLPEISEEEKPFELPEGWEWTTLNTLAEINPKIDVSNDEQDISFVPMPLISTKFDGSHDFEVRKWKEVKKGYTHFANGDIAIAKITPCFENSKAAIFSGLKNNVGVGTTELHVARPYSQAVNQQYLLLNFKSPSFLKTGESQMTGSAGQKRVPRNFFENYPLPYPPLQEQERIVNNFTQLMILCDHLEQHSLTSLDAHQQLVETLLTTLTDSQNADELAENWARISEHFDTLFTTEASIDALKQTILQLAVMGKLVPQDPNDEPASELLKRIAQEKAQLVKDGKIKKQKPLPPISDEEIPFELPEGWKWCLFEDVVDIQSGITKGRNLVNRKLITIPYLRVANVQRGYLDLSEVKEIDIPEEEQDKYHVIKGDLLITEGGDWDTVGRTTVWCHEWYIANQNHVFKGRIIGKEIDPYWLETYMNSPYSRDYFASASKQTTNLASINKTQLRGCPVAIPPSSEANKIMLKLNDFNELCEKLKLQLQSAQQTQLHLADALTDAAIN